MGANTRRGFDRNRTRRRLLIFSFAVGGGAINAVLGTVVHVVQAPLYLDSIMTIVVALHFGLIPGVVTAVVTNGILAATGQVLFPFVCCNILTAVISVCFRRRIAPSRNADYLWLGLTIALVNGVIGSVLAYTIYSGVTEVHGIDRLVMGIMTMGRSLFTAVFWSGILTNVIDKVLSALVAMVTRPWASALIQQTVLPGESV